MSRTTKALSWLGPVAVMTVIAVLLTIVLYRLDNGASEREQQQEQIAALQAAVSEANQRLEDGGEEPVEVPETDAGVVPVQPSQTQIRDAVAAYCADGKCRGSSGADGADGAGATEAQVVAAVVDYCGSGQCAGPGGGDGANGANGLDGANGMDGAAGRPPTAEEISAAVAAFCANDACRGPAGNDGQPGADSQIPGPQGEQGPPGPTCPDGFMTSYLSVLTRADPADPTTEQWRQATVCTAIGE